MPLTKPYALICLRMRAYDMVRGVVLEGVLV